MTDIFSILLKFHFLNVYQDHVMYEDVFPSDSNINPSIFLEK